MFSAMLWARHGIIRWDQVKLLEGSMSLQLLRTASIGSLEEAVAVITLGQTMAAFNTLTTCKGSAMILRHSLQLAKPWYPALAAHPEFDTNIIGSIFWDVAYCLVTRKVPVIRYICRDPLVVDRLAGICPPLLPVLYDLCLLSNRFQDGCPEEKLALVQQISNSLKHAVATLELPDRSRFTTLEVAAMHAQVRMYHLAALLVIHRIVHPIGTHDASAKEYADSILHELASYKTLFGPNSRLQLVVVPVFLAALETPGAVSDIWTNLSWLVITPRFLTTLSSVVEQAWERRNNGFHGSLFDLIGNSPDLFVIP
jgi:hypothetical protein